MKMKYKVQKISYYIFSILLICNPFFSGETFSVIAVGLLVIFLIITNFRFSKLPNLGLMLLFIIFSIGFSKGMINEINHDFIRDIWTFFKPLCIISLGAVLGSKLRIDSQKKIFRTIILVGMVSAVYHFIEIIKIPGFTHMSLEAIRDQTRRASLIEALALCLILFDLFKARCQIFSKWYLILFLVVISSSIVLFVSRTMLLVLFIYIGFLFSYFKLSFKSVSKLTAIIILIAFIFSLPEQSNTTSFGTFINKIRKSPTELFFSEDQKYNRISINQDWRGYEALMAITQTVRNGNYAILFGNGFGSLVDLKITMNLGGQNFRYVPKIHNGYAELFFKTGIIGLIFYIAFFIVLFVRVSKIKSATREFLILKKIILASVITIIVTTPTIAGVYNDTSLDSILLIIYTSYVLLKRSATILSEQEPESIEFVRN